MTGFLDAKKFISPAIDPKETFDNAYSNTDDVDKTEWEEIKKDKSSIGFMYSYGYEGTYGITFSKNMKKVFLFFYSD